MAVHRFPAYGTTRECPLQLADDLSEAMKETFKLLVDLLNLTLQVGSVRGGLGGARLRPGLDLGLSRLDLLKRAAGTGSRGDPHTGRHLPDRSGGHARRHDLLVQLLPGYRVLTPLPAAQRARLSMNSSSSLFPINGTPRKPCRI